jgi:phosphoribosyl 1,2-cyclic phosphate phosphodiesterase
VIKFKVFNIIDLRIIFLGTGGSHGVPVIGCDCEVCSSGNSKDKRLRSSLLVRTECNTFVFDTGPDFRAQMLAHAVRRIDGVFITHEHKDHTAGLDDVRAFNYIQRQAIDVFGEQRVLDSLRQEYAYVFVKDRYPGVPDLNLNTITTASFDFRCDTIIPIRAYHHKLPVLGYRIGKMAYITDAKTIPHEEKNKLKGLDVLIINALRTAEHISHFNTQEALGIIDELKPKRAYLTHMSHKQLLHNALEKQMPENIFPAYDGLVVEC